MILTEYDNQQGLEDTLAKMIANRLKKAIDSKHRAVLLVSGGKTPTGLYKRLANMDIAWEKVVIGLVDDRMVEPHSAQSNALLLQQTLLTHKAAAALFHPLVISLHNEQKNLSKVLDLYGNFLTGVDVCLLGMGTDGHTASLFPGDEASKEALKKENKLAVAYTNADVEPTRRISCSRNLIEKSDHLFLMIVGEEKRNVLETAQEKGLPIAKFFHTPKTRLNVFYAN
ncbi:MAG: 6-phosphogluconolactonase [Bacteroidia bacterium]|nr:6-phosphogluconolactonase [Bacteroidia bacterium]